MELVDEICRSIAGISSSDSEPVLGDMGRSAGSDGIGRASPISIYSLYTWHFGEAHSQQAQVELAFPWAEGAVLL